MFMLLLACGHDCLRPRHTAEKRVSSGAGMRARNVATQSDLGGMTI